MNRAARSNWVRFEVRTTAGRDAHGASVSATVGTARLRRDVQLGTSYLASSDPRVHFGLGEESGVGEIVVTWPGGETEAFDGFEAGRTHRLTRGSGSREE